MMVPFISPEKLDNNYIQTKPSLNDFVLMFKDRSLLCSESPYISYPKVSDFNFKDGGKLNEELLYLFKIGEVCYFLYNPWNPPLENIPAGFDFAGLMDIRAKGDTKVYLEVFTAWHLNTWYKDNRFCGRCGKPMSIGTKDSERNVLCQCGNMVFPKIMPAVIVGVRNGDRILMTRYANRAYTGWALIAGFVEIGETPEETVYREVLEETGVKVKNITYYASQPWGIDQDLLLGFYCDLDGESGICLDSNELAVGEWVFRDEMEERKDLQSLTATMMEAFRRGLDKEPFDSNVLF